jgi:hypothetical protein
MINAVIYVRRFWRNTTRNIEKCEEWCETNKIPIHARYVEDNISGNMNDRFLLKMALTDIRQKRARFFVSSSLWDWMVDFQPGIDIVNFIMENKGCLISLEEDIDTRTDEGRHDFYQLAAVGKYLRALKSETEQYYYSKHASRACPGAIALVKKYWENGLSIAKMVKALNMAKMPYHGKFKTWNFDNVTKLLRQTGIKSPKKIKIDKNEVCL